MALATFKLISKRPVEVEGKNHPAGTVIAILAAETESRVRWIFGRMSWSAYEIVRVEEPKPQPQAEKAGKK